MKRRIHFLLILLILLTACQAAFAQEAEDLTKRCTLKATVDQERVNRINNGRYDQYWSGTGGSLTIRLPEGEACQGISLSFFRDAAPLTVYVMTDMGMWKREAVYADGFRNAYIPVQARGEISVSASNGQAEWALSALSVWGEGELPESVQRWTSWQPDEEADLLLFATHPDDELIWFGGLIPYYTVERDMKVQVAYADGAYSPSRVNELLDGLWHCGVRRYPELGPFRDFKVKSEGLVRGRWGKNAAETWCTAVIRRYRPKVVVTHAQNGESGHNQHKVLSKAVVNAATEWAGNAEKDPDSAKSYGTFTPQKLYLHRYGKEQTFLDWTQPLSTFNGKTGAEIAQEAFDKHISQDRSGYRIYVSGPNDSRYFGLYYSLVGPDEARDDLFEHIENSGE